MTTEIISIKEKHHTALIKQYGKIQSFGGKTFQQNVELTSKAIEAIKPYQRRYDRQHSQFQTTLFIIGKHYGMMGRSIRQICSEVDSKESALLENMKRLDLLGIDISEMRQQLESDNIDELRKVRLEIELRYSEISRQRALEPIQGTMKDILILKKRFDEIKSKMSEKEMEEEEVQYWILRLCSQSMRDVRMTRVIKEGNQLALEQMGVNPVWVQRNCLKFLQKEESNPKTNLKEWHKELARWVEKLKDVPTQHARIMNMDLGIFTEAIFTEDYNEDNEK